MGGDEIVADWLGDTWATNMQVTSSSVRFWYVPKRFKTFRIWNPQNSVYIGKFHATTASFTANAFVLGPNAIMEFNYIDLYEIGYSHYDGYQFIKVLGINEY